MIDEIKEITKVDKRLLDKIEYILGAELSSEEYDGFYNYFNEIRKPNIIVDIKDVDSVKDLIINLQEKNEGLKERCEYLQRSCNRKEEEMLDYRKEYMEQEDYKSRCDKAIECINYYAIEDEDCSKIYNDEEIELLAILQGEDK